VGGKPTESRLGEELLDVAGAQIAAGHYQLAVVISQVAVETVAEVAFTALFAINVPRSRETMMKVLPDRSFQREGTRRLWQDLTGDRISKSPAWKEYAGPHIQRRNRAAHGSTFGLGGDPITMEGAEQSLNAARGLIEHMHDVLAGQFERLFGPHGERAPQLDQWRALSVLSPRPGEGLGETEPLTEGSATNAEPGPHG
jgi:hypothetical protein